MPRGFPNHLRRECRSPKASQPKTVSPREIQKLLDAHPYNRVYQEGVFDCSDMSIETARYLQEKCGYDTSVIGDDGFAHAWVYVWVGKNTAWAIECAGETTLLRDSAGEVVGDEWWDIVFYGHWLDSKAWSLSLTGYELYYPKERRSQVRVREWYEVEKGR